MNMCIYQHALNSIHEPIIRELCCAKEEDIHRLGFTNTDFNDISITLSMVMLEISQNVELNQYIDRIPVHSLQEVFEKVFLQMFLYEDFNCGRVAALFCFAHLLTVRALDKGLDGISWVRVMLVWAEDFLVRQVARWVCSRGGWKMVKEWYGPSNKTWVMLCATSIALGLWFYFKKN